MLGSVEARFLLFSLSQSVFEFDDDCDIDGVGAMLGGIGSGYVVQKYSVYDGIDLVSRDWFSIWMVFATYAMILGILFAIVFKYKHNPDKIGEVTH